MEALDAVRAGHAEVAPAVRVFEQRAENALRGIVILACMLPVVFSAFTRPGAGARIDATLFVALFLAIMVGMARSVVAGARELVRKGFRYEDVRDGVRAIAAEQRDYCAALCASPGDDQRRRELRRRRALSALVGVALVAFALLAAGRPNPAGGYETPAYGVALVFVGIMLIALAFVSTVANPRRASVWERLGEWLWTSRAGQVLFRLAARGAGPLRASGAPHPPATGAAARTPLAVFDDLPRAQRARVAELRAAVAKLQREADALAAREAELDGVLVEARATPLPPDLGDGVGGRRALLLDDVVRARREAGERRARLLGTLENVRLQLLRFRSGPATPEDVAAELIA